MTQEGLEFLTDIRNFTTLLFVILRESSIESDLGMPFATRSCDLAFHDFAFFKHSYFHDSGKQNFYILDS